MLIEGKSIHIKESLNFGLFKNSINFKYISSVQSFNHVRLLVTP